MNDCFGASRPCFASSHAVAARNLHNCWAGKKTTATLTGYAYETVANKPIITGKTKGPDVITMQPDIRPGSLGGLARNRR